MNLLTLQRRSLVHHWRSNAPVLLGVAIATAVITGALLVGDSLRGSLRAAARERLAGVKYAVQSPAFFREQLAADIAARPEFEQSFTAAVPVILTRGSISRPNTHATVHHVNVLGVDERFWQLSAAGGPGFEFGAHEVWLNQALADDLGARAGDDVLLRIAKPAAQSPETLLGRRDDTTLTLRLTMARAIPAAKLGVFDLTPTQQVPRNAFVPLATLQKDLARVGRVNTLLVGGTPAARDYVLQDLCQRCADLADVGLTLRTSEQHDYASLESDAFLLPPPVEAAARAASEALGLHAAGILTYLANTVAVESRPSAIVPYSTIAAIDTGTALPAPGEMVLNDWTADQLGAQPGDTIAISYYVVDRLGHLSTENATFRLAGIVPLSAAADDSGFTPTYPGVTDAKSLADWNPPFPIDLRKIRPADEDYWRQHKATPKGFISLSDGQRLWARHQERFGRLTAWRVYPASAAQEFLAELRRRWDVAQLGLHVTRPAALEGATDFGDLFLGFSFFLIAAATLLIGLLYRLGIERRASEIGLLLAVGFSRRLVGWLLLGEGLLVALLGVGAGRLLARGYGELLLAGLRSWWGTTIDSSFLHFHSTPESYAIGCLASLLVAMVAIAWSLRGVARAPARSPSLVDRRQGKGLILFSVLLGVAIAIVAAITARPAGFFVSGTALLMACFAALAYWLRTGSGRPLRANSLLALPRLGVRNARRHAGRSLATVALVACATFIIAALQAFRLDPARDASGTGGFTLLAESDSPLMHDLDTPEGRTALNFSDEAQQALADVTCVPFRMRAGEEASCLNLYRPRQPIVLGAPDNMIERGGFTFAASEAQSPEQRRNPWILLRGTLPDGAIPAIADEAAARWQMHLDLGGELPITDERGRTVRLRLVGLLGGSILQGQLIVAEPRFEQLFPSVTGYAFYLIETPPGRTTDVARVLARELADYGFAVTPTARRLADLFRVQNTYLSAFQTLGGLGLLLGTVGLVAIMLRNVWERRGELALLRALGFAPAALAWLVLVENIALVGAGLLSGAVCAALVDAPHLVARASPVPWASLLILFGVVFAAGLLAGAAALASALRTPLLPALRSE
jgi:putative ABC transport system permease protein